jgi:hypothetical protein
MKVINLHIRSTQSVEGTGIVMAGYGLNKMQSADTVIVRHEQDAIEHLERLSRDPESLLVVTTRVPVEVFEAIYKHVYDVRNILLLYPESQPRANPPAPQVGSHYWYDKDRG